MESAEEFAERMARALELNGAGEGIVLAMVKGREASFDVRVGDLGPVFSLINEKFQGEFYAGQGLAPVLVKLLGKLAEQRAPEPPADGFRGILADYQAQREADARRRAHLRGDGFGHAATAACGYKGGGVYYSAKSWPAVSADWRCSACLAVADRADPRGLAYVCAAEMRRANHGATAEDIKSDPSRLTGYLPPGAIASLTPPTRARVEAFRSTPSVARHLAAQPSWHPHDGAERIPGTPALPPIPPVSP